MKYKIMIVIIAVSVVIFALNGIRPVFIDYNISDNTYCKVMEVDIKDEMATDSGERVERSKKLYYLSPEKIRIEWDNKSDIVEIYDGSIYMLYSGKNNVLTVKECFRDAIPDILHVRDIKELLEGQYEFLGYEKVNEIMTRVVSRSKLENGHTITEKYYIHDFNSINLPVKSESFFDNHITDVSFYTYGSVNKEIKKDKFTKEGFPEARITMGSPLVYNADSFEDAERVTGMQTINIKNFDNGFIINSINAVPYGHNPNINIEYKRNGEMLTVCQRKIESKFKPNCMLGSTPCQEEEAGSKYTITFRYSNLILSVSGRLESKAEIIYAAEIISGGKLVN